MSRGGRQGLGALGRSAGLSREPWRSAGLRWAGRSGGLRALQPPRPEHFGAMLAGRAHWRPLAGLGARSVRPLSLARASARSPFLGRSAAVRPCSVGAPVVRGPRYRALKGSGPRPPSPRPVRVPPRPALPRSGARSLRARSVGRPPALPAPPTGRQRARPAQQGAKEPAPAPHCPQGRGSAVGVGLSAVVFFSTKKTAAERLQLSCVCRLLALSIKQELGNVVRVGSCRYL